MAETRSVAADTTMATTANNNRFSNQKRGSLQQMYSQPVPLRTFPLPTFFPNNPISLAHVAFAWIKQLVWPPPAEPAVIHEGIWSEATGSVHVKTDTSARALWEQGFYGKGSLSRSEPNWLKREKVRRGLQEAHVSEILTEQRREDRLRAKWERARLEQEIIRKTREEEAHEAERQRRLRDAETKVHPRPATRPAAPVGPLEILALPNSEAEWLEASLAHVPSPEGNGSLGGSCISDPSSVEHGATLPNGSAKHNPSSTPNGAPGNNIPGLSKLKAQKSVRFSPKVESATFQVSDPPSPDQSSIDGQKKAPESNGSAPESVTIVNKEHLQLMPEEALWLSFGLGVLAVNNPTTNQRLSTPDLLTLFRQHSYFPPRTGPDDLDLQPDDDFLIHYAVYHHFRSLGWVPRAGTKFGVDWLLYTRGPVFDHAEFGLMVIPSYSDPFWEGSGKKGPPKTWQQLHSVVRVLSQVMKSLVLVYVNVPPPPTLEKSLEKGFAEALKHYSVREITVKRWSSNRNRG